MNVSSIATPGLAAIALAAASACTQAKAPADTIYTNARIYTVNANDDWAESLAIKDGVIVSVGTNEVVARFAGSETDIVDVEGRMLMPGIHDVHVHTVEGGLKERFECAFSSDLMISEILDVVRDCAASRAPGEWIRGGQWATALLESDQPPNRQMLDTVTTEHPVFLMDWAVHNAWLNTSALEALGIDGTTKDPTGGRIARDADGNATGVLIDTAAYEAQERLPAYTDEQYIEATRWAIDQFAGYGITSFKDAMVGTSNLNAYRALASTDELTTRVYTSLAWKSAWSPSHEEELANLRERKTFEAEYLQTGFAKIMLDGVPMAYTSAMLEPYLPSEQHGANFAGKLIFAPEELSADVTALDAQGITVKIHATGDRSARVALDAIEAARRTNGDSGLLHEISHAQYLHADDIPRFAELNVAAEMCPILWYPGPSDAARAGILGEKRAGQMWPMRSLLDAGALVVYGSDWPAVVPNANPWPGIEAMVTRRNPYGTFPGAQWPEQVIELREAIRIVTLNGAKAVKRAKAVGSIEVGKMADFIVLDQNVFEIPHEDISEVQVLATVINGRVVHDGR